MVITKNKWGYKHYRLIQKHKKVACELCGNINRLEIHHIDGRKENSDPINLMTLCKTCHSEKHRKYKFYTVTPFQNTSKFIRAYGKSAIELAREIGCSINKVYQTHNLSRK